MQDSMFLRETLAHARVLGGGRPAASGVCMYQDGRRDKKTACGGSQDTIPFPSKERAGRLLTQEGRKQAKKET